MANSSELVSVLLSVYNSEKTLEDSTKSLLNQTHSNLEILIANDGSTDGSKEICRKFQLKDERIVFFDNKVNIGLTKSLNNLAKEAKGSLIARQDADDISFPMRIEKQIQFMNRKNLMQLLPDHWLSKVIRKDQEFHFIFQINSLLIKKIHLYMGL